MRKINLVPNMITAFGLSCGLYAVFKGVEAPTGSYHLLYTASLLLLLAGFADLLDGAVARIMKAESEFGVLFDSLSDAISFGVAPSVFMLKSLTLEQGTGLYICSLIGAMLYSLCGILRLVRFNVKTAEAKGNLALAAAQKKHFTGLPIPAAAFAAISANLLLSSPFMESLFVVSNEVKAIVLTCVMVVVGFFMVSNWKFPSLKVLHFRVPSFYLVLVTAVTALLVLYGIFHFYAVVLAVVWWGYVLLGWVLSIIRLIAGKKSKTLEDFEPEEDE
jgi:CDP-diacylglycerol---serine O-phosphatidyltransferase